VEWATDAPLGQLLYVTYNETDFTNMASQYDYYGGAGYDKKNSTQNAHPESRPWPTVISQMYKAKNPGNDVSVSHCFYWLLFILYFSYQ
jgi:hypothetical protein